MSGGSPSVTLGPRPGTAPAPRARRPSLLQRLARRAVLARMDGLDRGQLVVHEEGDGRGRLLRLGAPAPDGLTAEIRVRDPRFWSRVALGGSIGAAEAFVEELWDSPDPTAVVRVVARNPEVNDGIEGGIAAWLRTRYRRWHDARANSRAGSRTNIAAHYDLGNDFFERFLDPSMMYSCAVFPSEDATLEEAQEAKLDLICEKLRLRPEHRVVEIGTGWGGFAVHAARRVGCRVVTTTISREQREEAERRIREAGVEDRVELLSLDYRDLPDALGEGGFDRLVSIEMIEAVGEAYLPAYLDVCARLLRPDGLGLVQSIVIAESQYATYRQGTDFIQRYVFPGSFLPSVRVLRRHLQALPLELVQIDDITAHYPPTLRAWADAVAEHADDILAMGYSEDFLRLWAFYLAYCEGGFLERAIGDVHLLLAGPGARVGGELPVAPPFPDGLPPFVRHGGGTPPLEDGVDQRSTARHGKERGAGRPGARSRGEVGG